ncbi:Nuclear inhibitor of protein phosphatase 1 [Branchiostoma belcheri]|nr:Nuclear inhibitor of protein phosphatase 1 [Branchiostoma belcheri]
MSLDLKRQTRRKHRLYEKAKKSRNPVHQERFRQDFIGVPPLKHNGNLFSGAKDKAYILLQEFKSIFTSEDSSFVPWMGSPHPLISNLTVQPPGVLKLLKDIKPNKASGPDAIPNRVIKELASELSSVLAALFNQSLHHGCVTEDWTKAMVTPVFEKGGVHGPGNYRPVSLTCVISKLMEHVLCTHSGAP